MHLQLMNGLITWIVRCKVHSRVLMAYKWRRNLSDLDSEQTSNLGPIRWCSPRAVSNQVLIWIFWISRRIRMDHRTKLPSRNTIIQGVVRISRISFCSRNLDPMDPLLVHLLSIDHAAVAKGMKDSFHRENSARCISPSRARIITISRRSKQRRTNKIKREEETRIPCL